jgi:hypothetical protein
MQNGQFRLGEEDTDQHILLCLFLFTWQIFLFECKELRNTYVLLVAVYSR